MTCVMCMTIAGCKLKRILLIQRTRRGGRGQSFDYELLYNGEGESGNRRLKFYQAWSNRVSSSWVVC